jgi:hypothetical protein
MSTQYLNFAFTSYTMTVNGALVFEKNVSFRRFVIKSWNCYIICQKIIKVWRVTAIKKVALLSTRYNIFSPPLPPTHPLCHLQLSLRHLHDRFIRCPDEIYDIFIFMRPTLLLPASLFPFHNLLIQPSSRTHNNFTFDTGLKCLPVYWWSYLTTTCNWEVNNWWEGVLTRYVSYIFENVNGCSTCSDT